MSNHIRRVARDEKHFQIRAQFLQAYRQLLAVDSRHNDISDQQVNLARMLLGNRKRLIAITGMDDLIAVLPQRSLGERSNSFLVFYDQNCFAAAFACGDCSFPLCDWTGINAGKIHFECSSNSHLTPHIYPAAVLSYDLSRRTAIVKK